MTESVDVKNTKVRGQPCVLVVATPDSQDIESLRVRLAEHSGWDVKEIEAYQLAGHVADTQQFCVVVIDEQVMGIVEFVSVTSRALEGHLVVSIVRPGNEQSLIQGVVDDALTLSRPIDVDRQAVLIVDRAMERIGQTRQESALSDGVDSPGQSVGSQQEQQSARSSDHTDESSDSYRIPRNDTDAEPQPARKEADTLDLPEEERADGDSGESGEDDDAEPRPARKEADTLELPEEERAESDSSDFGEREPSRNSVAADSDDEDAESHATGWSEVEHSTAQSWSPKAIEVLKRSSEPRAEVSDNGEDDVGSSRSVSDLVSDIPSTTQSSDETGQSAKGESAQDFADDVESQRGEGVSRETDRHAGLLSSMSVPEPIVLNDDPISEWSLPEVALPFDDVVGESTQEPSESPEGWASRWSAFPGEDQVPPSSKRFGSDFDGVTWESTGAGSSTPPHPSSSPPISVFPGSMSPDDPGLDIQSNIGFGIKFSKDVVALLEAGERLASQVDFDVLTPKFSEEPIRDIQDVTIEPDVLELLMVPLQEENSNDDEEELSGARQSTPPGGVRLDDGVLDQVREASASVVSSTPLGAPGGSSSTGAGEVQEGAEESPFEGDTGESSFTRTESGQHQPASVGNEPTSPSHGDEATGVEVVPGDADTFGTGVDSESSSTGRVATTGETTNVGSGEMSGQLQGGEDARLDDQPFGRANVRTPVSLEPETEAASRLVGMAEESEDTGLNPVREAYSSVPATVGQEPDMLRMSLDQQGVPLFGQNGRFADFVEPDLVVMSEQPPSIRVTERSVSLDASHATPQIVMPEAVAGGTREAGDVLAGSRQSDERVRDANGSKSAVESDGVVADDDALPIRVPEVLSSSWGVMDVVALCVRERVTGTVAIDTDDRGILVVFRDGDFVTCGVKSGEDSLVAFLMARGDISQEVGQSLFGHVPNFGRLGVAALIAKGYLRQENLWPVLRAHAEWVLTQWANEDRGTCEVMAEPPGRLGNEPSVFGGATGAEVFVDVARRALDEKAALERLGGTEARLALGEHSHLVSECALNDSELNLVTALQGSSVREVIQRAGEREVTPLLAALQALGVVQVLPGVGDRQQEEPSVQREIELIDEEALRRRVDARLRLVEEGDYFAILGVRREATSYAIRQAYVALRREFEPSQVVTAGLVDLVDEMETIITVLDEAYDVLKEPARRQRYRRALEGVPPTPSRR